MSRKKLIVCAGARRSGSTWAFNAIRLLFENNQKTLYYSYIDKYDPSHPTEVHLVKTHIFDETLAKDADIVVSNIRDPRDIIASEIRIGKIKENSPMLVERISNIIREEFSPWRPVWDLLIRYEDFVANKFAYLAKLMDLLELDADKRKVYNQLEYLGKNRKSKFDDNFLYHKTHVTNGKVMSYSDDLKPGQISRIERELEQDLLELNYHSATLLRHKPLKKRVGEEGYLTMAFGEPKYFAMACNLAMSLRWHDSRPVALLCDDKSKLTDQTKALFDYIVEAKHLSNQGYMSYKTHMPKLSPFQKTMFVDSDSIVVRDQLNRHWHRLDGHIFTTIGSKIFRGHNGQLLGYDSKEIRWDADFFLNELGLPYTIRNNGGFYYFEKNAALDQLIDLSIEYHKKYCETVANYNNEEPFFAAAMATLGFEPIEIAENVMATTNNFKLYKKTNGYVMNWSKIPVQPTIIHFFNGTCFNWFYQVLARRYQKKLKLNLKGYRSRLDDLRDLVDLELKPIYRRLNLNKLAIHNKIVRLYRKCLKA
ncbi:MAG: hypothetical protein CMK36_02985 [Porticoccaceae bacterium]|nr:hypothetical protein [Porticoccaceae bacterium]